MTAPDLRALERDSVHAFVARHAGVFAGRAVLDYGCGARPYRALVEAAGGAYHPYDRAAFGGNVGGDQGHAARYDAALVMVPWGGALCTQVLQYAERPDLVLGFLAGIMAPGAPLVLTYPTLWYEGEPDDLWRFTRAGMARLLLNAGFSVAAHDRRWALPGHETLDPMTTLAGGYGVVAVAR